MNGSAAMISVEGLSIHFGGVAALSNVSFEVGEGQITGLIGPNGAGKTTCFNCITGLYAPSAGTIAFRGENLLRLSPHRISGRGIARTFQNLELFSSMTALENVMVGVHARRANGSTRAGQKEARELLDYGTEEDVRAAAKAANPDIKVEVTTIPYPEYQQRLLECGGAVLQALPEHACNERPGVGVDEVQHFVYDNPGRLVDQRTYKRQSR